MIFKLFFFFNNTIYLIMEFHTLKIQKKIVVINKFFIEFITQQNYKNNIIDEYEKNMIK